jgi:hypothetical protein
MTIIIVMCVAAVWREQRMTIIILSVFCVVQRNKNWIASQLKLTADHAVKKERKK